tara:strand:+ start:131 stop:682 length:552 start_codon:yes stop_codon:yes gene_type:complete
MGKFKDDLNIGQKYEEIILKRAKKTYPLAYIQKGKFKYWDIYIPEVNIALEVKYDERNQTSGNILIEFECNDKPSGITTSKADFWILFDKPDGDPIWFLTEGIRRCIYENNFKTKIIKGDKVGDPYDKKVYLIKREILYKYQMPKNAWMDKEKQNKGTTLIYSYTDYASYGSKSPNKVPEFYD